MKTTSSRSGQAARLLTAAVLVASLFAVQALARPAPAPKPKPGDPKKAAPAVTGTKKGLAGPTVKSSVAGPGKKGIGTPGGMKKSHHATLATARKFRWGTPPQSLRAVMRQRGLSRNFHSFSWRWYSRPYGAWLYFDRVTALWYYFSPQMGHWVPLSYIGNVPPPPGTPPPAEAGKPPPPPPGQAPQVPKQQQPAPDEAVGATFRIPARLTARADGAYPDAGNSL
jgi:hypothetical protein